jgi:hypothetical protein
VTATINAELADAPGLQTGPRYRLTPVLAFGGEQFDNVTRATAVLALAE